MHRDLRDARKPPAKPPPLPPPQCPEYPLDTLADVELQEVQPFLSHETTADILLRLLQQSTPDWNDNAPYRRPELLSSTLYNLASPGWSTSVNDVRMLISSESIETAPVRAYILGEFPRLAMSPSQHELVKSYLEVCSPEAFVEVIRVHFAQISTLSKHVYACRIVQQLVSMAATEPARALLTQSLAPALLELALDLNANYVVQACICHWPPESHRFILNVVLQNCLPLSRHRLGCCVVVRCLQHGDAAAVAEMRTKLVDAAGVLCEDPYGNYVIQYILNQGSSDAIANVAERIKENAVYYSEQKCSSNVVERLLKICDTHDREGIIRDLATDSSKVAKLMRHDYANYVVQTALEVSEDPLSVGILIQGIKKAFSPHGSQENPGVFARLLRKFPEVAESYESLSNLVSRRVEINHAENQRRNIRFLQEMDEPFGVRRRHTRSRRLRDRRGRMW